MFLVLTIDPSTYNEEMSKILNLKYFKDMNIMYGNRIRGTFYKTLCKSQLDINAELSRMKDMATMGLGSYTQFADMENPENKDESSAYFDSNASIIKGHCDNWRDVCVNYNLTNIKTFSEAALKIYLSIFKIRKDMSLTLERMNEILTGNYAILIYDFISNEIGLLNKNKSIYINKNKGTSLVIKDTISKRGDFPYDGFVKVPKNSLVVYDVKFLYEKFTEYEIRLKAVKNNPCYIMNTRFGLETAVGLDIVSKFYQSPISTIQIISDGEENFDAIKFASERFSIPTKNNHYICLGSNDYLYNPKADDFISKLAYTYASVIIAEQYTVCYISALYDSGFLADEISKYLSIENWDCKIVKIFQNVEDKYLPAYFEINSLNDKMYLYDCLSSGISEKTRKFSPCGECESCLRRIEAYKKANIKDPLEKYYLSDKVQIITPIHESDINSMANELIRRTTDEIKWGIGE